MSRRQMKPWEVIATLLTAKQLYVREGTTGHREAFIRCPRTGKDITLDNVRTIQVEHWPIRHIHDGPVSPDNAIISLVEGHQQQSTREKKADRKERRLRVARLAKAETEHRFKQPKWRLKRKVSGEVVRVRTR